MESSTSLDHLGDLQGELDSYLTFLRSRAVLEEKHSEALVKLVRQDEAVGKRGKQTTIRRAWQSLRDSALKDARAHALLADEIRRQLVEPMTLFRDGKERIRRRIKEEDKASATSLTEYTHVVQRLAATYRHTCEAVLANNAQEEAVETRKRLLGADPDQQGVSPPRSPPLLGFRPRSVSHELATANGLPTINTKVISGTTGNLKETQTPTAHSHASFKAGKQLTTLMNRLGSHAERMNVAATERRSSATESNLQRSLTKSVKVKREAEEADREYRKGVFQLETLRLNRDRVLRSSHDSLTQTVRELGEELHHQWLDFAYSQRAINVSRSATCDVLEQRVREIDPDADARLYADDTAADLVGSEPVCYENYFVGKCLSLIFGVGLTDYAAANPGLLVPIVVQRCIAEIDCRGLSVEGIYRVSGSSSKVQEVVLEIERDERMFQFDPNAHDVFTICGVLKLYLRQLPTPLFPLPLADRELISMPTNEEEAMAVTGTLASRLRRLAPAHQATLKALCQHLARVAAYESENRMSVSALAVVFSPAVFGDDDGMAMISAQRHSAALQMMILFQATIFAELPILPSPGMSQPRSKRISSISGGSEGFHTVEAPRSSPPNLPGPNAQASDSSPPRAATLSRRSSIRRTSNPLRGSISFDTPVRGSHPLPQPPTTSHAQSLPATPQMYDEDQAWTRSRGLPLGARPIGVP
ncbi:uncharacterized protein L969DRAFT_90967 [Mixia osmundae IAM 14324]|uniref:Rho-GAP domain-containing protein n=1 Tax=Mixia osmundae (strain CBS 9802 / IAM 14324 / JCM 22182 / KY 12970) TaxID=764103 RepID=G7DV64_MIXOS|nr:uncharacterized protein L969DRAFT_90967 [Mixia osmundae IAM 14324]KEI36310.1 hypothetical protein L969DRAFT_90967 [Mixia osmundae IAM 14324]GAA94474.1 hypothetical protein E5Q_01126 [Mixia osmundae IAM 14324]